MEFTHYLLSQCSAPKTYANYHSPGSRANVSVLNCMFMIRDVTQW